jgi:hypothetical protein
MTHCSDDELVLLYYGEDDRQASHVAACAECAGRFGELTATLQMMDAADVPERGHQYGLEVWQRIRHQLPEREPWWQLVPAAWTRLAAAAIGITLVIGGFAAGRLWPDAPRGAQPAISTAAVQEDHARRVLLLTVADHLDRSDRVLTDIVNTPGGMDISAEQASASDLVAASRLYRQEAIETNEASLAAVLDELERGLLEIVHRPSRVSAADVDEIRLRIDSAALLFKVRIMGTGLRELTETPPAPSSPSNTSTIG